MKSRELAELDDNGLLEHIRTQRRELFGLRFSHATGDEETDVRLLLQRTLAGNSLGIAASGHFCHLGDDGSLVIPHDWR